MNAHRGNSILSDIGAFQREKNCSRTGEENNGRKKDTFRSFKYIYLNFRVRF